MPVFLAEEDLLRAITGFHLHRGALAAMHRPELAAVAELLDSARGGAGARRIAVLEDLVDHTNVGAAFRSAAALGVDAVLVASRCADPLYRRSVCVSMGTVFQVPWTRINAWPDPGELRRAGFAVAALALSEDAVDLDDFAASPACTAPDSRARISLIGLVTAVEVSFCVRSRIEQSGFVATASATTSGDTPQPNGTSTLLTSAPVNATISRKRSPNTPHDTERTRVSGPVKFAARASSEPVPDAGKITVLAELLKSRPNFSWTSSNLPVPKGDAYTYRRLCRYILKIALSPASDKICRPASVRREHKTKGSFPSSRYDRCEDA